MADLATVLLEEATQRGKCLENEGGRRRKSQITPQNAAKGDTDVTADAAGIELGDRVIQVSIMGRPNVGKSSLLNAFVGSQRTITGPTPGLTRDAIQVQWEHAGRSFRLVDTAGQATSLIRC